MMHASELPSAANLPDLSQAPAIDFAACTDQGLVRKKNEDSFLIAAVQPCLTVQAAKHTLSLPPGDVQGVLFAVADGMGGQGDGDVASQTAIEWLSRSMLASRLEPPRAVDQASEVNRLTMPNFRDALSRAVASADSGVRERAQLPEVSSQMGTTLTVGYISWPLLYVAHVGDSRAYVLRRGQLYQITTDHTVADRLAAAGLEKVEKNSPLHHMLYNCLGGGLEDSAHPEIHKLRLERGDRLLLCSDGLTNEVSDETIVEQLSAAEASQNIACSLVRCANAKGGRDNITLIVGQIG